MRVCASTTVIPVGTNRQDTRPRNGGQDEGDARVTLRITHVQLPQGLEGGQRDTLAAPYNRPHTREVKHCLDELLDKHSHARNRLSVLRGGESTLPTITSSTDSTSGATGTQANHADSTDALPRSLCPRTKHRPCARPLRTLTLNRPSWSCARS